LPLCSLLSLKQFEILLENNQIVILWSIDSTDVNVGLTSQHRSQWSKQITITLTEGALLNFFNPGLKNCWHGHGTEPTILDLSPHSDTYDLSTSLLRWSFTLLSWIWPPFKPLDTRQPQNGHKTTIKTKVSLQSTYSVASDLMLTRELILDKLSSNYLPRLRLSIPFTHTLEWLNTVKKFLSKFSPQLIFISIDEGEDGAAVPFAKYWAWFFLSLKVRLANFLLVKATLFWLGITRYFFDNPGSKVAWSRRGSNPGPSDSQLDPTATPFSLSKF